MPPLWPGDVLLLDDEAFGLEPGLYVVTGFPSGEVELRATWRNEDNLLSTTATAYRLEWAQVCSRAFLPLRRNLYSEADQRTL